LATTTRFAAFNARRQERGAVILAGGEGVRLRALTHRIMGYPLPKQFCPVLGNETLLEQTRSRVALAIPTERTILVVTPRSHRSHYLPLLNDTPLSCVVEQPHNRETAPAILYGLLRLAKLSPDASVAIFPSDHFVSDDRAFMDHVEAAFEAVVQYPQLPVLLAVTPKGPQPGYGWMEPSEPVFAGGLTGGPTLYRIRRFCEKPDSALAHSLWRNGSFWNSFVIVARMATLLRLTMRAMADAARSVLACPAADRNPART